MQIEYLLEQILWKISGNKTDERQTTSKNVRFKVITAASMKLESSGMNCRVVKLMLSNVSEVRTASIIRAMSESENFI
jgi:hypothetical protein